jgi:hypothetical protein
LPLQTTLIVLSTVSLLGVLLMSVIVLRRLYAPAVQEQVEVLKDLIQE